MAGCGHRLKPSLNSLSRNLENVVGACAVNSIQWPETTKPQKRQIDCHARRRPPAYRAIADHRAARPKRKTVHVDMDDFLHNLLEQCYSESQNLGNSYHPDRLQLTVVTKRVQKSFNRRSARFRPTQVARGNGCLDAQAIDSPAKPLPIGRRNRATLSNAKTSPSMWRRRSLPDSRR